MVDFITHTSNHLQIISVIVIYWLSEKTCCQDSHTLSISTKLGKSRGKLEDLGGKIHRSEGTQLLFKINMKFNDKNLYS